uniref:Putative pyrrole-condensing enzyme n=1 Tax=Streptomyces griseoviridis TaxID=45398 RepID=B6VRR5_STRGD|nr:putative pyrrole-condensing enzyme [Streptomyces griseoviridis]
MPAAPDGSAAPPAEGTDASARSAAEPRGSSAAAAARGAAGSGGDPVGPVARNATASSAVEPREVAGAGDDAARQGGKAARSRAKKAAGGDPSRKAPAAKAARRKTAAPSRRSPAGTSPAAEPPEPAAAAAGTRAPAPPADGHGPPTGPGTAAEPPARARAGASAAAPEAPSADVAVLGADAAAKPETLGGKAARLGEMIEAGFPVPPAVCLTTELFHRFLRETGLDKEIAGADRRTIRELVTGREIPAGIASVITGAYRGLGRPCVAVRSSAGRRTRPRSRSPGSTTRCSLTGDDAVLDAVRSCWASLWSDRAGVYHDSDGDNDGDSDGEGDGDSTGSTGAGSMAVVIQEMVQAEVSGVLFTVDPVSGREHRLVVEACRGLGEGLVSGRVSSDFFALDDRTFEVTERLIRYKVMKCAPVAPGQVGMEKVDAAARNAPCLTGGELRELAQLAVRVREHYGAEQDIEWALRDGELLLLQTRPITTVSAGAPPPAAAGARSPYVEEQPEDIQQGTMWSRMDIGEIFVGLMTPLGLSWARHHQRYVHGPCAASVGARDMGDPTRYMGYLQGHDNQNVSYHAHLLGQCPPTKNQEHFTRRFVSEEVDLDQYRNPFGAYPKGLKGLRSANFWARTTVAEMRGMAARAQHMATARLYEFDRSRALDLSLFDRRELHVELGRYLVNYHDMHVGYMPYYINAFGAYGLMTELCAKWLGDAGANLQNRLKMDMSSLRTVASAQDIWELTQAAQARPEVLRLIRETPLEKVADALLADVAGQEFWEGHLEPFLRENGVRGRQEMELTNPRWVDDPAYVFQMIRRYADDSTAVQEILARDRTTTGEDIEEVLARLPRMKRATLRKVIGLYIGNSTLREVARMAMVTSIWQVRNIVYEVARRLTEEGLLHSVDEVAYLEFQDIQRYLAGDEPARDIFTRERIDEAQRLHDYNNRLPEPPLTFMGEHDATRALQAAVAEAGTGLTGLGSSPGRITGRARIIEDLVWQADEFQVGEILVTRYTDASWTPLFAIAGGVVTDIGSMLSHSSIVSREFNVPSVVNTKHATQRINTGDLIVVDGDSGVVEIIEPAAGGGA